MKKIKYMYLAELFLMAVLFAAGCGKTSMDDRAGADTEEISEVPESETTESESEELTEENKENVLPVETESSEQMPFAVTEDPEEDRVLTIQGGSSLITFDIYTEEQNTWIGDSAIYTNRCIYPVVTIEDHEDAAAKINADIQERVASCQDEADALKLAEYDYDTVHKSEDSSFFPTYYNELTFTVTRADRSVLSFLVEYDSYYGGVHGLDNYTGLNYDVQTGELIAFTELSENNDSFCQRMLAYQQELADSATYQEFMFPDAADKLEQVLYQAGRWYFSSSGLVCFSNPYELAPFYAGMIEFTVPYSELDGMGMKEKYRYEGTTVIHLQSELPYFCDINGDGQEEEIQFVIDKPGNTNTDVHFIIDGIDFASQHAELSERFSGNDYIWCWTKCFLYDMDMQDDMIEIVFQMNHDDWEENIYTPCMFFYRYEKDGSLTYLGRAEGDINGLASGL